MYPCANMQCIHTRTHMHIVKCACMHTPCTRSVGQSFHFLFLVEKGGNVLRPLAHIVEGLLSGVGDLDAILATAKIAIEGCLDLERVERRVRIRGIPIIIYNHIQ